MSGQHASELTAPTSPDPAPLAVIARDLKEKRYQQSQKMVPGLAMTVRYEVNSPCWNHTTNCFGRNFCAIDWCALYPKGTLGTFNWHYNNLPAKKAEVCPSLLYNYKSMPLMRF